ncbi:MAG: FtsW/RodA/SpoVE family cell cycle protein [Patescibacteria group bacterium]|nr:FtsW/RodA/SpoVE family cell cycle protein [Patescibacteria group bacterium]
MNINSLPLVGKMIVGVSISLVIFSIFVLNSIASFLFPAYYFYVILAIIAFLVFYFIDFEVLEIFSTHLYLFSIMLLLLPIIFGQVTRGAVRWVEFGGYTLQPSEIAKPFLFLFASVQIAKIKKLSIKRVIFVLAMLFLPLILIFFQPSLGVTIITLIGFLGALFGRGIPVKQFVFLLAILVILLPVFWLILAPYQKGRITAFLNPWLDPLGQGYNSIQSMISVASGGIFGRGLGKGVQTQLAFLPERHTDFIFAAIGEELGFIGSFAVLILFSVFFWLILRVQSIVKQISRKCFASCVFVSLFAQTSVHIGMNLGLLPVTGLPLPLVSAGGSALLGTSIILGILMSSIRK